MICSSGYHLAGNRYYSGGTAIGKFGISLHILVAHPHVIIAGIHHVESERYCRFPSSIYR
jgi:hypothetical protein